MVGKSLRTAIRDVKNVKTKTNISFDTARAYIGLERVFRDFQKDYEEEVDTTNVSQKTTLLAQAKIAASYLEANNQQAYAQHKNIARKVHQAVYRRRGEVSEKEARTLIEQAQRTQQEKNPELLEQIIEQFNLQPTKIGDVKLYLPNTEHYVAGIEEDNEDNIDKIIEDFSWKNKGFTEWSVVIEESILSEREELQDSWFEDEMCERYVEQISERYLSMRQTQALALFFKEAEPRIYRQLPTNLIHDMNVLYQIRQNIQFDPLGELALRLQVKQDKQVGIQLDEQHNKVMLEVQNLAECFGGQFKPTFVVGKELIQQEYDGRTH